jgi:hypothetical protein
MLFLKGNAACPLTNFDTAADEVYAGIGLKKLSSLPWFAFPEHALSFLSPFSTLFSVKPFWRTRNSLSASSSGLIHLISPSRVALSFSTEGFLKSSRDCSNLKFSGIVFFFFLGSSLSFSIFSIMFSIVLKSSTSLNAVIGPIPGMLVV